MDNLTSMDVLMILFCFNANLIAIGLLIEYIKYKRTDKASKDPRNITQDYYKLNSLHHTLGHLLKAKGAILFTNDIPDINPAIYDVVNKMKKILEERKQ